jgi:branched-chain amino acid transport system ATP-binding protein
VTALLEVKDLNAGYRGLSVVHHLSFSVEAGSIVALLGANGAGKSTTLNTIAGLLPVIGGQVTIKGWSATNKPAHIVVRRGLALVPQDRGVVHRLTVVENLRLTPRRHNRAIDAAFELFPALAPLADRQAGLLSGGEQQMLALARALVLEPEVLLIDEMSAGLAPQAVERLFTVIRAIADQHGTAVVIVEQHASLALVVADQALVLYHGDLAISGSADELIGHPELLESTYLGGRIHVAPA